MIRVQDGQVKQRCCPNIHPAISETRKKARHKQLLQEVTAEEIVINVLFAREATPLVTVDASKRFVRMFALRTQDVRRPRKRQHRVSN